MDVEKNAGLGMVGLRKGIGTYIKNFSHMGVNKAQKELDSFKVPMPKMPNGSVPTRNQYSTQVSQLEKNLHNAKVGHNRAVAGTAAGAVAAGAGYGGYAAYQKSQNPEVTDLMNQNQSSQDNQLMKAASEELSEIFHGDLLGRLDKTAAIAYIPIQVPDPGPQEDVAAAQQAEVAPLPQPADPTQPDGSGGIDPAQLGMTQSDQQQEGPVGDATNIAPVTGEDPAFNASGAVVTDGAQPITPESQELQAILAAQQTERAQESQPVPQVQGLAAQAQGPVAQEQAPQAQAPQTQAPQEEEEGSEPTEDDNEEEKPKRQGAGSVSNAPAGEDKTAAALYDRLEKTAGRVGGFVDDLLGKNVKRLQGHLDNAKKPRVQKNGLIETQFPQTDAVEKGYKNLKDAKKRQVKAVGAVAGATGAAGVAGGVASHKKNEEKTASEDLYDRLLKTAADSYTVDNSPSGGSPGDQSKKTNNFWHKLTPAEVQEEDQTEPNGTQKALYERLTNTSGGYDAASQAANLSKKAEEEDAIDPDHDGDDDRPGSKNNPDKAEDDKKGVTAEAAKEEKEEEQEKKAFAIPGLGGIAGKVSGAAKEYAGHLTGATHNAAKESFNAWNTPEALKANAPHIGVSGWRNHTQALEGAANQAHTSMVKTRQLTGAGAGVGLAGLGTAGAVHSHHQHEQDNQFQQTASTEDDILNGLFKEAAAMIINEEIPEVKQHVDILDRIKF